MAEKKENQNTGPKGTDSFKATILKHLTELAEQDELFAKTFAKKNKNIDECIAYIFTTVKATGCTGFTDDEVYQMAVHYYDEDEIKIGDLSINGSVVVNHSIQLSPEEIEEAKENARNQIFRNEESALRKKKIDKLKDKRLKREEELKEKNIEDTQASLF